MAAQSSMQRDIGEKQKIETDGQSTVRTVLEKKARIKTVVVETQHVRWTIRCSHSTSLLPKVWEGNIYHGAPELKAMNSEFSFLEDAKEALISIIKEGFKGEQSGQSCKDFKS